MRDVQPFEQSPRATPHFVMTHQTEGVERLAANPDILGDRHIGHQIEFLMDHRDAVLQRVERGSQPNFLAFEPEGAGVRGVDAGDDLHQRRFAGAVLAHQRVDMAALETEGNIVEREHAGERLAHVLDLEQILGIRNGAAFADQLRCRRTEHSSRSGTPHPLPPPVRTGRGKSGGGTFSPPRSLRRGAGWGLRGNPQFFFMKSPMLVGVTSWNGM